MGDRRIELAAKRDALLARSDVQRGKLAQSTREIETRLRGVDHVVGVVRGIASQPLLLAGGLATILMIGPRRLLGWAGRGLVVLSTARQVMRRLR